MHSYCDCLHRKCGPIKVCRTKQIKTFIDIYFIEFSCRKEEENYSTLYFFFGLFVKLCTEIRINSVFLTLYFSFDKCIPGI